MGKQGSTDERRKTGTNDGRRGRLQLSRVTLRRLRDDELVRVRGGDGVGVIVAGDGPMTPTTGAAVVPIEADLIYTTDPGGNASKMNRGCTK